MWRLELLQRSTCYLDSNVLIYAFEGERGSPARLRLGALFEGRARGRMRAFAGVLVRAEVLVGPLREGNASLAAWYWQLLSGQDTIAVLALDARSPTGPRCCVPSGRHCACRTLCIWQPRSTLAAIFLSAGICVWRPRRTIVSGFSIPAN